MIPQETIEQIREATDIVQLIGEYLRLKKRGRNAIALCPFHTEKTPSFNVSVDKQIFHCFGCGKGGNAYTFLMEHEKMSFIEAVKFLARKANITIREDKQADFRREKLEKINFANQVAAEFYHQQLKLSKYKKVLNDYLIGKRNITNEAIEFFQLGLAGEEWDSLLKHAQKKGLTPQDLHEAGLVLLSEKKGNYFDRFRHRLMIPIYNLSRKAIAFGGRTLKKGEAAKYINSPETPLYVKGNVLFNLINAKDAIRKSESVFVVEGYFDVISLWQVGVENVVASSGTAFTSQQARLLARFASEVYLFFDADSAGRNAAIKSVDALYDAGLEVKVIEPPQGEDPDSIALKFGRDKIDELKDNAVGFIPFRIKDIDLKTTGIIGKEKIIKEISAIGNKISDPTRKSLFFGEAAEKLNVEQSIFNISKTNSSEAEPPTPISKFDPVEYNLISLLFELPGLVDEIFESISPDDFDSKKLSRVYSAIATQYQSTGDINAQRLLDNNSDNAFISLVTELASKEWEKESVDAEMSNHLKEISEKKRKKIRAKLLIELEQAESNDDNSEIKRILEELKMFR